MLEVEIEPGMRDGQEYPFVAEGEQCIHWTCASMCVCVRVDVRACSCNLCGWIVGVVQLVEHQT